jgi:hypothetical protein
MRLFLSHFIERFALSVLAGLALCWAPAEMRAQVLAEGANKEHQAIPLEEGSEKLGTNITDALLRLTEAATLPTVTEMESLIGARYVARHTRFPKPGEFRVDGDAYVGTSSATMFVGISSGKDGRRGRQTSFEIWAMPCARPESLLAAFSAYRVPAGLSTHQAPGGPTHYAFAGVASGELEWQIEADILTAERCVVSVYARLRTAGADQAEDERPVR